MVVLNRIYTRTGDDGTTALGSGERRPKYDLRVEAYGTVDETNAAIGVVRLHLAELPELDRMLGLIQNDLFDLGAPARGQGRAAAGAVEPGRAAGARHRCAERKARAVDLVHPARWHACRGI